MGCNDRCGLHGLRREDTLLGRSAGRHDSKRSGRRKSICVVPTFRSNPFAFQANSFQRVGPCVRGAGNLACSADNPVGVYRRTVNVTGGLMSSTTCSTG